MRQRLDIAHRALNHRGFRVRITGGGMFGVVIERNWVVGNSPNAASPSR